MHIISHLSSFFSISHTAHSLFITHTRICLQNIANLSVGAKVACEEVQEDIYSPCDKREVEQCLEISCHLHGSLHCCLLQKLVKSCPFGRNATDQALLSTHNIDERHNFEMAYCSHFSLIKLSDKELLCMYRCLRSIWEHTVV